MSKIRNISGEDKVLPWLDRRLVLAGAVVEVPAEHVHAYTSQESNWAPADDEAQALHDQEEAKLVVVEEEAAEASVIPDQPTSDVSLVEDNDSPADRAEGHDDLTVDKTEEVN